MSIKTVEKSVLSSDRIHELKGVIYLPQGTPKAFLHVVHGMTEHIGRYEGFMREMAKDGYIVFGYDNLGHGKTARNRQELGYIAKKDGWKRLANDVAVFSSAVRSGYGKNLPYYLLGHSMGSFIVRTAAKDYVVPDKLIIMGTGGKQAASGIGLAIITVIKKLKGEKYVSKFVDKLAFGSYNKKFKDEGDQRSWLSTKKDSRDAYRDDEFCNFKFSVSAMRDLVVLSRYANSKKWFKRLNKDIPVLLVSGGEDPVGNNGKGVKQVYGKLKKVGSNAQLKLYEDCRHEILNDVCAPEVVADIKEFLKNEKEC